MIQPRTALLHPIVVSVSANPRIFSMSGTATGVHCNHRESTEMELKVRYLGGHAFEASSRGHVILSDQPFDNDGFDSGMTPPEIFLASLGTCAGYYVSEYLRIRGLPDSALEIQVSGAKGEHSARFVSLKIEVSAPYLNERLQRGIQRAVESCFIHNTLLNPPDVDIEVCSSDILALAAV